MAPNLHRVSVEDQQRSTFAFYERNIGWLIGNLNPEGVTLLVNAQADAQPGYRFAPVLQARRQIRRSDRAAKRQPSEM